jgi:hypothetical protein
MRNPYGLSMYSGPWSKGSSEWTEKWKKQVDWADDDDGIFYIPVHVFKEHFADLTICHYDDWKTSTL